MHKQSIYLVILTFGLILLASVACSSGNDDKPEFVPGGCGLAAYNWLPTEQVGSVVSFSEIDNLRYSAATIDAMLTLAGADMFTPSPFGIRVYRLRYGTQDKGQAIEATGLVIIPWIEGETIAPRPQVLYTHGTTGFANACAPSF
ncbi:MAG: hypothetical protein JRF33_11840, partial [Deltaproteobacteria bacterium]|nr:hypothetical protein [Deltaproteobacteria bacterium]